MSKQQRINWRWPSEGKGITIGWAVGVIMNHWGVSSCCINPPVAKAHHRNDANTPRSTTKSHPHPPKTPRPSGVTIVGPTTAIATHTHPRRTIVPKRVATPLTSGSVPGPDIATVWTCPTPVYTHTARRGTSNTHTHTARVIVLCALLRPTCPKGNATERHQAGMQPQQRKHMGASPPCGEDTPNRRQVQMKEKEGRGGISKEFCVKTDLCPLASPRVALVGVACSGTPTKATRGEARGHPW